MSVSKRVIAYYEADGAQPPGAMLVELARALQVSADELLGLAPLRDTPSPKVARLLKRIERLAELPAAEQRAVLKWWMGSSIPSRRPAPGAAPPHPHAPNAKRAENHFSQQLKQKPDQILLDGLLCSLALAPGVEGHWLPEIGKWS